MAKQAREAALSPQKKSVMTKGSVPTLDYKGRVNTDLFQLYPGLSSKIKTSTIGNGMT